MAGNKKSGRPSVILNHPDKNSIIRQIVERELGVPGAPTFERIAKKVGLNVNTLHTFKRRHITEEMRREIAAKIKREPIEEATNVLNKERMDVAQTYEALAHRVEKLVTKAENNEDDGFALAAMEGLRKVLKDIATMHGKMATNLTVDVKLSESPEWVTMKQIIQAVCAEVPEAREPFLRHMRKNVLSVTEEQGDAI
ncbi:hypothetical protein [Ruegeria atlantica]|uniref:hypothetical protein n=1 Tax=Ruegeria atlantica TaxID=81569 RepID=UPI0014798AEA|nr:hypothetical protein [Ruegeria atlantica]